MNNDNDNKSADFINDLKEKITLAQNTFGYVPTSNNDSNTATQVIDFAKTQISKLTDEFRGAAPGEYDTEIAHGVIDIVNNLINAAVKIEALNTLPRLNLEDEGIINEIFRDSIFKQ